MSKLLQTVCGLAFVFALAPVALGQGFDSVKQGAGATAGKVVGMTKENITLEQSAGLKKEIPVNTVTGITFRGAPPELNGARVMIGTGRFEDAKETLGKINTAEITNDFIKQDVDYYKALIDGKLALSGAGDPGKAAATLFDFVKANLNSFHFYEACELIGDLHAAKGDYEEAEKFYGQLAKAPWKDMQMRAMVLVGRVQQAQGKHNGAIAEFEKVLATGGGTPEADRQMLAATLGKAISWSQTDKVDQAITMVTEVIAEAEPEDVDLHARAYNALGACHVKGKNTKDALLAYLHVDLLYYTVPEAHAEALAALSKLWNEVGKGDRARQATVLLKDRYPNSRWARAE